MHRLALISTSKSDWPHDIASDSQSLAFHLGLVHQKKAPAKAVEDSLKKLTVKEIPGVYDSSETAKLTVLASSVEMEQHDSETSVRQSHLPASSAGKLWAWSTTDPRIAPSPLAPVVFPDFKVVHSIPISKTGAQDLYDKALSPTVARLGNPAVGPELKSWVLPYEAVILLCPSLALHSPLPLGRMFRGLTDCRCGCAQTRRLAQDTRQAVPHRRADARGRHHVDAVAARLHGRQQRLGAARPVGGRAARDARRRRGRRRGPAAQGRRRQAGRRQQGGRRVQDLAPRRPPLLGRHDRASLLRRPAACPSPCKG